MIPVVVITSGHRPQILSLVRELRHQSVIDGVEVHVVLHRQAASLELAQAELANSLAGLAHVWSAHSILSVSVGSHDHKRVWSDDFPVATARNAALVLMRTLGNDEAILVDDDVSGLAGFLADVIALRQTGAQVLGPFIFGARLTGASSADRLTRLIGRLRCTESNHYPIAVGHIPVEFVSGGCAYISLHPAALLPIPFQYNEFWAWCQVMRTTVNCNILLASSSVLHDPENLPTKGIDELASELEGIYLLKILRAIHKSMTGGEKVLQPLDELIAEDRFSPVRRLKHIENALIGYSQDSIHSAALAVGIDPPYVDFPRLHSLLISRLSAERVARYVQEQIKAYPLQVSAQLLRSGSQ